MEELFQVDSSSFQYAEISASLKAASGSYIDLTQASTVTGSFSGDGTQLSGLSASYLIADSNTTSSWANSASVAISASWAPGGSSVSASYSNFASSASYSDFANSASWAPTSAAGTTLNTGSTYEITASVAVSASIASTASYVNASSFDNLVLAFEFKFSNTTTADDPGSGKFRYDNVNSASITNLYVSDTTNNGLDISGIVDSLKSGSYQLYIQQKSDSTKASIFQVKNTVTDNGTWFTVPIEHISTATGGLPSNNQICSLFVINKNSIVEGATYPVTASWSSQAKSSSYVNPGAMLWVVSGSNGVAPAFLAPYDYSVDNVYRPTPIKEGYTHWDHKWNDWAVYDDSGARTHLGREIVFAVHNPTATVLPRMAAVYMSGSSPSLNPTWSATYKPDVYLAMADGTNTKTNVIGIVRQAIPSGSDGYVLQTGTLHNSDVSSYGEVGTQLWLSPTVPGGLTSTKPGQPNEVVSIAYVIESGIVGSLLVQTRPEPPPANAYAGMTSIPTIVDNTSSFEIYIGSGSVNLYDNDVGVGAIKQYPILPATFSVVVGLDAEFVYATSNGVTASYEITTDFNSINGTNKVLVTTLYRADEDAHWMESKNEGLALANKLNIRLLETEKFAWESGFSLIPTGSNYLTITDGQIWFGATNISQNNFNSFDTASVAPKYETHWAYHSASVWTIPVQTDGKWSNGYYDDGTNLVALASNSWSLHYIYRILGENPFDEDVFIVTSNYQYPTFAEAQADILPTGIPAVLDDVALMVGRLVFQSGSTTATGETAFGNNFGQSTITQHNSLGGLQGGVGGQYYHMSLDDYTGTGTGNFVRANNPTITATGSFFGTASWSSRSTTASYAAQSSTSDSASYSGYGLSGSSALFAKSSSYADISNSASYANKALTASFADNAEVATSASWASASISASYYPNPVTQSNGALYYGLERITMGSQRRDPTGFYHSSEARSESSLVYDIPSRKFMVSGSNFYVYSAGKEYIKNSESLDLSTQPTGSVVRIYYDPTTMAISTTYGAWDISSAAVPIATVFYDGEKAIIGDERHGIQMDGATQEYLHETMGPRYASGYALQHTASNPNFILGIGHFYDDDLGYYDDYPMSRSVAIWHSGSVMKMTDLQPRLNITTSAGTQLAYDTGTGTASVANNRYVAYWLFAVNGIDGNTGVRPITVMGQRIDISLNDARTNNEPQTLAYGTFPLDESKLLWRTIYSGDGALLDTTDYRQSQFGGSNYTATDHGTLAGLADDDHQQYLSLASRGGQTVTDQLTVTGITSSLAGTSSWANSASVAISASWAPQAVGGGTTLNTGSTYEITASWSNHILRSSSIHFNIDGTRAITTGDKGTYIMGSNMNISRWKLICNTTSSIAVEIQKSSYDSYPTFTSVTNGNFAQTVNLLKSQSFTDGWVNSFVPGDVLKFIITSSNSSASKVNLILEGIQYV